MAVRPQTDLPVTNGDLHSENEASIRAKTEDDRRALDEKGSQIDLGPLSTTAKKKNGRKTSQNGLVTDGNPCPKEEAATGEKAAKDSSENVGGQSQIEVGPPPIDTVAAGEEKKERPQDGPGQSARRRWFAPEWHCDPASAEQWRQANRGAATGGWRSAAWQRGSNPGEEDKRPPSDGQERATDTRHTATKRSRCPGQEKNRGPGYRPE